MDWLTFISKLIEALAWPVALLIGIILFRHEISDVVHWLKKLKFGSFEAEFEWEIKQLHREVEPSWHSLYSDYAKDSAPVNILKIIGLAKTDPRAAVIEAWKGVDSAIVQVFENLSLSIHPDEVTSPFAAIQAISRAQILNEKNITIYYELRSLYDRLSQQAGFTPSHQATLDYIELASHLEKALRRAGEKKNKS